MSSFRSALVTGGRSGIGLAIVEALERDGVDVRVLDVVDGFDVSDPAAWESVVEPVDLACLNAGVVNRERLIGRVSDEQYRRIVGVNVDGVVFGVRRLSPRDAERLDRRHGVARRADGDGERPALRADEARARRVRALGRAAARRAGDPAEHGQPGDRRHAAARGEGREALEAAGFPLLQPEDVAAAVLRAAEDDEVGQAWVVQPGREPLKFRFPGVPGPRVPGKEGMVPQL